MSFGPVGRLAWTFGVLVVAALCVFSGNPLSIGIWLLFAGPLLLRSIWARARVS